MVAENPTKSGKERSLEDNKAKIVHNFKIIDSEAD